ncbi:hypothetical protein FS837_005219 [Tulasnella sp. UAMH 9824]|nr:hypothetical protein FS837_005219 [Tulasnella sp. UAMH 9824]
MRIIYLKANHFCEGGGAGVIGSGTQVSRLPKGLGIPAPFFRIPTPNAPFSSITAIPLRIQRRKGGSDSGGSDQPQFQGKDATECEDFITAIVKLAFAQGKQRDDQWMADFAATCMVNNAMRWWSTLDEEVQGSWKLLRHAMLSKYRPMFHGGSGEEAEKFIGTIRDKAIDEGKRKDYEWILTYAESCFAGEALRWYTHLDSQTKNNWEKLQQAVLIQYPRGGREAPAINLVPTPAAAASAVSAPSATRRGRIRISNSSSSKHHYLSKLLPFDYRVESTASISEALELEWSASSSGSQTLYIPEIPGYDLLGMKQNRNGPSLEDKFNPPIRVYRRPPGK